ncbi:MAG: hypothetical protein ACYSR9_13615, partial [Planctomycetota bacterium]|jgi:hypothetical protein
LDTAAQFYEKDDERTLAIFGANQQWMITKLDPEHLSKPFTIRIQNSSALPESKAGRLQRIIELRKEFPGLLPDEEVLEMLELGTPNKFFDSATAAVRNAEAETDEILHEGKDHPPEEWEYHIEHWEVHAKAIQQPSFNMVSKKNRKMMLDHIRAHEMFMLNLMVTNPVFQQRLAQLKQFPLLMSLPKPVAPQPPPGGPVPPGGGGGGEGLVAAEAQPLDVQPAIPGAISPETGEQPLEPTL